MMNLRIDSAFLTVAAIVVLVAAISSWVLEGLASLIGAILKTHPDKDEIKLKPASWKIVFLGMLGGFIAEIAAIAVFPLAESQWCRDMAAQGSYCDGQGPMILVLTIPLCAVVGSCASLVWTWFSFGISAESPWASVFRYRGGSRAMNLGLAVSVQTAYWAIFSRAAYLFTRSLL